MALKPKSVSTTALLNRTNLHGWSIVETAGSTAAFRILSGGVAAPSAPSGALASPAAPGNVENGVHTLKVTYVTAAGESPASAASGNVTVADKAVNGQIVWTIPVASGNNSGLVTARKLYRTEAGGGTYKLLATVSDNTTLTYTDNIADGSLGATAPTENTSGALVAAVKLAANGASSVALAVPVGDESRDLLFVVDSGSVSGAVYAH